MVSEVVRVMRQVCAEGMVPPGGLLPLHAGVDAEHGKHSKAFGGVCGEGS